MTSILEMSFEDLKWAITLVDHPKDMPHEVAMRRVSERIIKKYPSRTRDVIRIMAGKNIPVSDFEALVRLGIETLPEQAAALSKYLPTEKDKNPKRTVSQDQKKRINFKALVKSWTPISGTSYFMNSGMKKWTNSGIECLELNADCSRCSIHKLCGLTWDVASTHPKKCFQPVAVQSLLDSGMAPNQSIA